MMEKRSSRDMLSDLPLSIIHNILALAPIRDAVKTCVLSRQWRYTWASLPHLVFDAEFVSSSESNDRICRFITKVLFLHKGPVHEFEFHVSDLDCFDHLDHWLLFLSRNDVRMLILHLESQYLYELHSSLYSFQNLTHLELFHCVITPPPPAFKGFPFLRYLVLSNVVERSRAIGGLFANSPLLEKLTLNNSPGSSELSICAPNLKYFCVRGDYKEICLDAPLLTIMSATLFHYDRYMPEHEQQKSSICNYDKFLDGLSNLEELSASAGLIKYLSIGFESCHRTLVFHHLRVIDLRAMGFTDAKQIWIVVRLITGAPNLHKFKISWDAIFLHTPDLASIPFWDSEVASNIRFERLKVIEMRNVSGFLNEMKLVEFLLASSPMLETLSFNLLSQQNLLHVTSELLRYRRASTNAQILFR